MFFAHQVDLLLLPRLSLPYRQDCVVLPDNFRQNPHLLLILRPDLTTRGNGLHAHQRRRHARLRRNTPRGQRRVRGHCGLMWECLCCLKLPAPVPAGCRCSQQPRVQPSNWSRTTPPCFHPLIYKNHVRNKASCAALHTHHRVATPSKIE